MGILSGVLSYLFGLSLNLLDAAIGGFLGALGFDLDTFEHYFPAAKEFNDVIVGFAVGLLFIMLIFQIFRNFGVMLDMEAEDPLKMIGKTALFFGMILCSRSIVNMVLRLLTDPYSIFLNTASDPYEFELLTLVTSMLTSVFSNPFMSLVAMILMLVLGWQFLKLTIECVERYIVFYFILYCAPVVFATGAFKSTAQIFKSWCRMLASQAILLLLNIWSIKLFMSFMPVFESDADNIIFNFLMGFAFLKFAQKADTLLRILGLNTASTGDMVHSLGGTVAGVALAIKSAGNMAQHVASFAGQHVKGASGGMSGSSGKESGDVSGIGGNSPSSPSPSGGFGSENAPVSGVADSVNAAKQSYVNDVLNSARVQIGEDTGASSEVTGNETEENRAGGIDLRRSGVLGTGGNDGPSSSKSIGSAKIPKTTHSPRQIDDETLEGLSNLAHGLPHDQYDPEKGTFSGGGFPEFTGENANLIGASQLSPADGFHQSKIKRADGSIGTVYQNSTTGSAHVVQFASVDNGVIQGTICEMDSSTGKMGEDFAFKAVHDSVPGSDSFSSHAVQVRDASGGAYHLATGAKTDFFSPPAASSTGDNTNQAMGSAYTPGGASKMAGPSTETAAEVPSPQSSTQLDHDSLAGSDNIPDPGPVSSPAPISNPASTGNLGGSIGMGSDDADGFEQGSVEPGQIDITPPKPQNQVRRFSKNNPANVEVFRRGSSNIETYEKPQNGADAIPNVPPPEKP